MLLSALSVVLAVVVYISLSQNIAAKAEVAASILTLQRSMLVSFGAVEVDKIWLMNSVTGADVCLFVLMLGISI